MSTIFVSYYTAGYAAEAEKLVRTLRLFDLPHCIMQLQDHGRWALNKLYQAPFIRDMMLKYEPRPVVFIDCDARIRRAPLVLTEALPDSDVDFAARFDNGVPDPSLLYFKNSGRSWRMVRDWESLVLDQQMRHAEALARSYSGFAIDALESRSLPDSYGQLAAARNPGVVIEHNKISRFLLPEPK